MSHLLAAIESWSSELRRPNGRSQCGHATATARARQSWPARRELGSAVFEYLEVFYTRECRHSTLAMRSPAEYEQTHQNETSIKIKNDPT
jgi:hypothetical protein